MKQCSKCSQLLDESCFGKCGVFKDGLQYRCKVCLATYYQEHKEEKRAYSKVYSKVYSKEHKEAKKVYMKTYMKTYMKNYRQKNYLRYIWHDMKQRCTNSKNISYGNYGGRGIKVCYRWLNSFEDFKEDIISSMGERPTDKHSIDRINNDGNYEPDNIKWSTTKEQNNNKGRK